MDELIDLIEHFFEKDTKYHSKEEIRKKLNITGESKQRILDEALKKLEENGKVLFDKKGYRKYSASTGFAFGQLQINKAGTGFVHTPDGYTILIENSDLKGALNGDNVVVCNIFSKRKDYYSGEIYKIVKRRTGNVIFEVVGNGLESSLIPYDENNNINIKLNKNDMKNLIDGELIIVSVDCDETDEVFDAELVKVLGHKDDPGIDIKAIFEKYSIPMEFSKEALEEANNLSKNITDEDLKDRVDLRNENIFAIDCDGTKDRDDAIGIKKLNNGNYLLKVNIAHVSHYIKKDMALYKEAIERCTSHYLANTCNPMLPRVISNGICSLDEGVDRLTRTVEMEIKSDGEIVDYKIYKSVINSKKSMSYGKVNQLLSGKKVEGYECYREDLELLRELNSILEESRNRRNYLNFGTLKIEAFENESGNIEEFGPNDLGLAGKIIENAMVISDVVVYTHYSWFPLTYRVHEAPSEEKVKEVIDLLRNSGVKIPKVKNVDSRSLKGVLESLDNSDVSQLAKEYLLRSMKKARYDIKNEGHYALQYDIYGTFTAPIRRIADFLFNSAIDSIDEFNYSQQSIRDYEKFLTEVCEKANRLERLDMVMEDEAIDMLMAEHMKQHIGEEVEVMVTDLGKSSMLVRTKDYVRGKIKFENMLDDEYRYDREKNAVIGRNTKKKYQIGTKENAIVKDASKTMRTVDFQIGKVKQLKKTK